MQVSIIIVSYNVRHYLRQCLDSVFRSTESAGVECEIFVVDNHSFDGSAEYIAASCAAYMDGRHPLIRLYIIANRRNVGFGRANNQAVRRSTGKYVLFLNPDTIITERTLADCLREAEKEERLGAIGVKMLRSDGRFAFESRRGLPTPWTAFCKMTGLSTLFPKSKCFGKYYLRYLDDEKVTPIEIVSGAFMFCSRKALETCGDFDESFFMYGEDIDLSYRFLKSGFRNLYVPTPILHYKGESTHKNSFRYVHVFYQAMLIFFRKHFPASSLALSVPVHVAIYTQAFFTLIRQQLQAFARYLSPGQYRRPISVLYIGSEKSYADIAGKQESWGIKLSYSPTIPRHSDANIVAFSAETHSYEQILDVMRNSDHRSHIGTYFASTGVLIMGNEIYT